jgi:hypothetical protein
MGNENLRRKNMENNLEQSEVDLEVGNSDENPVESNNDSKMLGKFASADELVKAYEQLQSAFTKKSQELAELKDKASVAVNQKVETPQPPPIVIAGNSGNYAFTNVSEARTLHATTKVAENFFKMKGEKI